MKPETISTASCTICGRNTFAVICAADEVAAQLQYLRRFHRRRLQPLSNSKQSGEVLADRATFTQDYVTDIVACTDCGLVFRTPHPSAEAITDAYEHDHYGQARLASLFAAQLHSYRPKARSLARWLPTDRKIRIVEIGSFVGGFLAAGQERGWEMLGVDPGFEVSAFCWEKGLSVFRGTLAEMPIQVNSVDCIAIWNTFDQLPDPLITLSSVCRLLRPGGMLILRIPNGECFRWSVAQMRTLPGPLTTWLRATLAWNNLLAFPYLFGYSRRTIDYLLTSYGFTQIAVRGDTLIQLADQQTKPWAIVEESLVKSLCAVATTIEQYRPQSQMQMAPWLDVYYRQALVTETVEQPDLNVSPLWV